jgi:hypothetical protein
MSCWTTLSSLVRFWTLNGRFYLLQCVSWSRSWVQQLSSHALQWNCDGQEHDKKDTTFLGNSKYHICTFLSGTVYAIATQFCRHAGTLFINILLSCETDKIETQFFSVSTLSYMFHTKNNVSPLYITFGYSKLSVFFFSMPITGMSHIFLLAVLYNFDNFHHLSQLLTLSMASIRLWHVWLWSRSIALASPHSGHTGESLNQIIFRCYVWWWGQIFVSSFWNGIQRHCKSPWPVMNSFLDNGTAVYWKAEGRV